MSNRGNPHAGNETRDMNFQELITELVKAHSPRAIASLVAAFVFFHLLPIAHFLVIGTVLVISDWFTGVWAAMRRHEHITPKGLRRTIEKIVMYCLAIILVLIVEAAFLKTHYFVAAVALYISLTELMSNLENISSITGSNIIGAVKALMFRRFPFLEKWMHGEKQ